MIQHPHECKELLLAVIPQVEAFLTEAERRHGLVCRAWIDTESLRVYLRTSLRLLAGEAMQCLDIASLEVKEGYRRRGLFTAFMLYVQAINPYQVTYLEHTMNPLLEQWCIRHAWVRAPHAFPPSFYLLKC